MLYKIRPSLYKIASVSLPPNQQEWPQFIIDQILNKLPSSDGVQPISFDIVSDKNNVKVGLVTLAVGENQVYIPVIIKDNALSDFILFIYNNQSYPFTKEKWNSVIANKKNVEYAKLTSENKATLEHGYPGSTTEPMYNQMDNESTVKSSSILDEVAKYKELIKQAYNDAPPFHEYRHIIDSIISKNPLDIFKPDYVVMYMLGDTLYVAHGKYGNLDVSIDTIPYDQIMDFLEKEGVPEEDRKKLFNKDTVIYEKKPLSKEKKNRLIEFQTIKENGFYELPDGTKVLFVDGMMINSQGKYMFGRLAYGIPTNTIALPLKEIGKCKPNSEIAILVMDEKSGRTSLLPLKIDFVAMGKGKITIMDSEAAKRVKDIPLYATTLEFDPTIRVQDVRYEHPDKDTYILKVHPNTKVIVLNGSAIFNIDRDLPKPDKEIKEKQITIKESKLGVYIDVPEAEMMFGNKNLSKFQADIFKVACRVRKKDDKWYMPIQLEDPYRFEKQAAEVITDKPYIKIDDLYILNKKATLTTDDLLRLLGIQTLTVENSSRFVNYIPEMEKVLGNVAEICFQAQVDGNEEVALAAEAVYNKLKEFLEVLYKIRSIHKHAI